MPLKQRLPGRSTKRIRPGPENTTEQTTLKKHNENPLPSLPAGITAIDTHCHLDMAAYDKDRDQVITEACRSGVGRMITIGIDLASSTKAVDLADRYPAVYAAIGVHPHHAAAIENNCYQQLKILAGHPKIVAYGEIGLDFVKKYAPVQDQMNQFRKQIHIAKELRLPLIIHDRGAHPETMRILRDESPFPDGGVMHCFSGDAKLATEVIGLGLHISVPGIVTYKNGTMLQEVVRRVALDAILLETDGPFLAPVPERGKRNRPALVLHTARKIAELKAISLAEVVRRTTMNAESLFSLS
jgi:TatD DNase family protein